MRRHQATSALLALGCSAALLSACSSNGRAAGTASPTLGICQQVAAVLSDGPDPVADPVGYAEAQVLPLRQLHTSDKRLRAAIDGLSDAYEKFYETGGSGNTRATVDQAVAKLNAICPGAAP
jgi:hypothetical protein